MSRRDTNGDAPPPEPPRTSFSRRLFLKGAGGLAAAGVTVEGSEAEAAPAAVGPRRLAGPQELALQVNGEERALTVEPRTTLLSALRVKLEPPLTGAKDVCDRGACGACTVLLDGRPVYSCMQLAVDCEGREITTVEGLGTPERPSAVQRAFHEEDALMCGFCTPGFVVSVTACLQRDPAAGHEDVRAACAGNLCRCGTYPHVFAAAQRAGAELRGGRQGGGR